MLENLSKEGKRDQMKLTKMNSKIMCNGVVGNRLKTEVMIDGEYLKEVTE